MNDHFSAIGDDRPDTECSVRQIERLAFELTAWGAAASADEGQLARLRTAAEAVGMDPDATETLGLVAAPRP